MDRAKPYVEWVTRCGGAVRIVVVGERAPLGACDGLLLTGGEDVAPERYGESNRYCERVNPMRDAFELSLVRSVLRRNLPLIAVCRGIQVLAVALRGTLYQDIPRQFAVETGTERAVVHRSPQHTDTVHRLCIEEESHLARLIGARTIAVNSHHHQGLRRLPRSARVAARSADGLVEAIELPGQRFVLGVQWHPERWPHPSSARIMKGFLAACRAGGR